jgi:Flp pilus assembly protein TadG
MATLRSASSARQRGNALIEFLVVLPFFATILFGAMEFAQIHYDRIQLTNACREGVRRAAVGRPIAEIQSTTQNAQRDGGLDPTGETIVVTQSADGVAWTAAADLGSANAIPSGMLCRVQINGWRHRMLTGSFFSWLPGIQGSYLAMHAEDTMMRE